MGKSCLARRRAGSTPIRRADARDRSVWPRCRVGTKWATFAQSCRCAAILLTDSSRSASCSRTRSCRFRATRNDRSPEALACDERRYPCLRGEAISSGHRRGVCIVPRLPVLQLWPRYRLRDFGRGGQGQVEQAAPVFHQMASTVALRCRTLTHDLTHNHTHVHARTPGWRRCASLLVPRRRPRPVCVCVGACRWWARGTATSAMTLVARSARALAARIGEISMYVSMYVCVHICMHTHMHVTISIAICMYMCMYIYIHIYMYTCIYEYTGIFVYIYIYTHAYKCICVDVCMYTYTYRHTRISMYASMSERMYAYTCIVQLHMVNMCICICAHTCTCSCMLNTCAYVRRHLYMHMCMQVHAYMCMHAYMSAYELHTYTSASTSTSTATYICTYTHTPASARILCIHTYICIHTRIWLKSPFVLEVPACERVRAHRSRAPHPLRPTSRRHTGALPLSIGDLQRLGLPNLPLQDICPASLSCEWSVRRKRRGGATPQSFAAASLAPGLAAPQ